MNWKKIARSALCLLVVCALIVNISPMRVKAVEPISTALGLGIVAAALLMSAGVVYTVQSPAELEALGQSMHTYMYQWGTSAEKLDEVDEFFGYLQLYQPDPEDPDPHKIKFGKAIALGLATWMCSLLRGDEKLEVEEAEAPAGYKYYNGVLLPILPPDAHSRYFYVFRSEDGSYFLVITYNVLRYYPSSDSLALSSSTSSTTREYYFLKNDSWTYVNKLTGYKPEYPAFDLVYNDWSILIAGDNGTTAGVWREAGFVSDSGSVSIQPDVLIGDVAPGLADGSKDEVDIQIPDSMDFSHILTYGGLTGADAIGQVSSDLSSGSLSYDDYKDLVDFEYTPPAKVPEININLNTEKVTYELGVAARPLIINASSPDGGTLSYCWYQVNPNDFVDLVVEGAISPKFIPKTDEEGEYQYYCRVHNLVANGSDAYADSQIATIEIVAPGTVTEPDVSTDPVTNTGLKGMLADIGVWFSSLIDAVKSIPQAIVDGITSLFIPDQEFIDNEFDDLKKKFVFVSAISLTAQAVVDAFNDFDDSPPVIYIDLSDAESKYDWGGTAVALDLSWYARYKPTVDTLISAYILLWFAWRVFRKLPGIISGLPGDTPDGDFTGHDFSVSRSDLPRLESGKSGGRRR